MDEIKPGYTRVSEILQQWDSYGHIKPEVLANKCRIGTNVHEAICLHHEGLFKPLQQDEQGYYDSYIAWEKEIQPKLIESEHRYYCDKTKLTGQIDAIIRMPDDEEDVIMDYKTSVAENGRTWPLQAHFYHYLITESGKKLGRKILFLKLDRYGELPSLFEYCWSKDIWLVCTSALITYRYMHQ